MGLKKTNRTVLYYKSFERLKFKWLCRQLPGCLMVQNRVRESESSNGHFCAARSDRENRGVRQIGGRDHGWPGQRCCGAEQNVLL